MPSMTGSVQESLVTLCCFDKDIGAQIIATVQPELYDAAYRKIARKVYAYREQYRKPPGDHIIDLIDELCAEDPENADAYKRLHQSIVACKDGVNVDYILGKAERFVRQQRVRAAFQQALPLVQAGDLDDVEGIMLAALKHADHLFRPGLQITNVRQILDVLHHQPESMPTGIEMLDKKGIGPCRKELYLYIAGPKTGKTQHVVHLGKAACIIGHLKVLHITLEMSEERMAQRYLQAFFSISRRKEDVPFKRCKFEVNEYGAFLSNEIIELEDRPSFEDSDIASKLQSEVSRYNGRWKLLIKQFPTGGLTISKLKQYLDQLEVSTGFIPDMLIVDYTDLMEIDPKNQWQCLGKLTQDLRGIAVERNIAVVTASQITRKGAASTHTKTTDIAGDWTKIATADTIVVYSQTADEKRRGMGRLDVIARNEEDQFQIILSQNYGLGQYCFQSCRGNSKYDAYVASIGQERLRDGDDSSDAAVPTSSNGRRVSRSNGRANGNGNGRSNGHSNGNGNGHSTSSRSNGHTRPANRFTEFDDCAGR